MYFSAFRQLSNAPVNRRTYHGIHAVVGAGSGPMIFLVDIGEDPVDVHLHKGADTFQAQHQA